MILPIFRAVSFNRETAEPDITVEGDFVHSPAYTTPKGLKISESNEIWSREERTDVENYYSIDIKTLEISFDGVSFTSVKDYIKDTL